MKFDLNGILDSKRLAISRALSFVENTDNLDMEITDALFKHLGRAYRIGVTGPPGAGKSSLVDRIITYWRAQGKRIAVISVDPTSPFTGGAILGDRVRMGRHFADKGVFIRSMATRGSHGGLALRAQDAADIFDAAGNDIIVYETVGVGQVELDVAKAADTTLVVLVPESGDDIQAMKAGLMEIADLFIINKADRQGANQAFAQIQSMLEMRHPEKGQWPPQVIKTSALKDEGISNLTDALVEHRQFLDEHGIIRQNFRDRILFKIKSHIDENVLHKFWTQERRTQLDQAMTTENVMSILPGKVVDTLLKDEAK
ncbi:MAG: methylmalonyl Co-A mutase-associated GTPase MeaB [Candidatus Marinimicrobia bacterium]|jgi:LAO/AO transport system kinase|nr:methylmalonyl Co-A mutase-associated GTPase MeaB [Candidatus Neomarinimicrobiota bacterium]MBT4360803.1 methylmalonyl Co-A mutase-associated GTPase MeaB [Candidatus Neomarinimicrobiota bacterium]MBT4713375.1 methylmalonyl Co-A mutase-associated GTPase MeaB [Candidatus Neomarinimicrobiota bacterium]MBT4944983.1 methylmalonyl Co-A mutase-associated GTPase MeaB [Candidatus Neomarinimicrobiota bacterium]MBT5271397.1 methylmalonyl Co-A mutase-associated GTPase MeaB [Candidatus Neomarinimicrobiota